MKLFFRSLATGFLLAVLIPLIPFQNSCKELNNDVFRLHILANSDSAADQSIKLAVRDKVLKEVSQLYDAAADKADAEQITADNLEYIRLTAQRAVYDCGADDPVGAEITNMYFNTRVYDGFTMPSGYYDALRLTIGKARGQNWWCVMYPALCVGAAAKSRAREDLSEDEYRVISQDEYQFRFKIVEYYEQICSWFR